MTRRQQRARLERRKLASARALRIGGGALAATLIPAAAAQAQTYTVTNLNDAGAGSLRDAIDQANIFHSSSGADQITFQSGLSGAIHLETPLPVISDSNGLGITGPGSRSLTLDAAGISVTGYSVISNGSGAPLTISGLAMDNAHNGAYAGGFVSSGYGLLTLGADAFVNDTARSGGAVYADAGLRVTDSTFADDRATAGYGGAIEMSNHGTGTIQNSTIDSNSAKSGGGGVDLYGANLTLTDSTITRNTVSSGGGGGVAADCCYAGASTLALQDSIVAGNSATAGRDVYSPSGSTVSAQFSLIQSSSPGSEFQRHGHRWPGPRARRVAGQRRAH